MFCWWCWKCIRKYGKGSRVLFNVFNSSSPWNSLTFQPMFVHDQKLLLHLSYISLDRFFCRTSRLLFHIVPFSWSNLSNILQLYPIFWRSGTLIIHINVYLWIFSLGRQNKFFKGYFLPLNFFPWKTNWIFQSVLTTFQCFFFSRSK